jgi:hypothetical protein
VSGDLSLAEEWLVYLDGMLARLDSLGRAMSEGCRYDHPSYAVETEEIHELDTRGLQIVGRLCTRRYEHICRVWQVHGPADCCSIGASIRRLQQNRGVMVMLVREWEG